MISLRAPRLSALQKKRIGFAMIALLYVAMSYPMMALVGFGKFLFIVLAACAGVYYFVFAICLITGNRIWPLK